MLETEKMVLNAVNILLRTIGEISIQSIEDLGALIEAQEAVATIEEVTKAVLAERWDFNIDEGYTLPIAPDGTIPIAYNILDISSSDANLVMRQWKLYDKKNNTFIFESPQTVDVLWDMEFNSLTHPIRHYITIRAARIFAARAIGDSASFKYTIEDESSALYAARHSEAGTGRYNMLNGSFGLQVATKRDF